MKKISSVIILLCLCLFAGCASGSYLTIRSEEENTPSKMSMTYEKFDGNKKTTIKVGKDEVLVIKADIVTESGELDVEVERKDTDVYSQDDVQTSTFEITLDEEGSYILEVDADDHKGSYCFSW